MIFAKRITELDAEIGKEEARLKSAGVTVPPHPIEGVGAGMYQTKIKVLEIHLEKLKALGRAPALASAAIVRVPSVAAPAIAPAAQKPPAGAPDAARAANARAVELLTQYRTLATDNDRRAFAAKHRAELRNGPLRETQVMSYILCAKEISGNVRTMFAIALSALK